jgi:hypothetical protein
MKEMNIIEAYHWSAENGGAMFKSTDGQGPYFWKKDSMFFGGEIAIASSKETYYMSGKALNSRYVPVLSPKEILLEKQRDEYTQRIKTTGEDSAYVMGQRHQRELTELENTASTNVGCK